MTIRFYKYQGTGNDFIILDNRDKQYAFLDQKHIEFMCNRRFGVGADGLMLLNKKEGFDFEMKYYNADGNESSMCGNGGRCLVKFAAEMGIRRELYRFIAFDGEHEAEIDDSDGVVSLKMKDVHEVKDYRGDYILDTGSPHYIKMGEDVMNENVYQKGKDIRYNHVFSKEGINVNFVERVDDDEIIVRTYERGVEDETLSCGTGVTASAIVSYHNEVGFNNVTVITKGGRLTVEFDRIDEGMYKNIWLCGPAVKVFEGTMEI